MKFTTTILFAGTLFGLPSCQGSETEIPLTATGKDAETACVSWIANLPKTLEYPAQTSLSMEYEFEINESGDVYSIDAKWEGDFLSLSSTEFLGWGSVEFSFPGADGNESAEVNYEIRSDAEGLAILFDDHGFLEKEFNKEMPKALTLSPGNTAGLGEIFLKHIKEIQSIQGEEFSEANYQFGLNGGGALLHPAAWSRFLPMAQGFDIVGWGILDNEIRLQLKTNLNGVTDSIDPTLMPIDLTSLDGIITEIRLDRNSGSMLTYLTTVNLPIRGEQSGLNFDGMMDMKFSMEKVSITKNPPRAKISSEEETLNLDEYYATYLPMFQTILAMQVQQVKSMFKEKEAEDDFSF